MSIPKLVRLNDQILHRPSHPVEPNTVAEKWFQSELDTLVRAMRQYGGVGLAAPQVGINKQIFVCEANRNPRYPGAPDIPLQIYINPKLEIENPEEIIMQEGCLSVPKLRGDVPRASKVVIKALDREGKEVAVGADGFLARIFQHECDHLAGRIFLERVRDLSSVTRTKTV